MDQQPEDYESGIELKNKITGEVSIENVTFSYNGNENSVLKNISIAANKRGDNSTRWKIGKWQIYNCKFDE